MVLWMELLMSAPHQASAFDLWVGAGVCERVLACFLAGWGDRWLSPPSQAPPKVSCAGAELTVHIRVYY